MLTHTVNHTGVSSRQQTDSQTETVIEAERYIERKIETKRAKKRERESVRESARERGERESEIKSKRETRPTRLVMRPCMVEIDRIVIRDFECLTGYCKPSWRADTKPDYESFTP
ncbi:hypothetical protein DPMN_194082 [Dreissena polymorpha]|uniref:Uncharacterized protein n=1 Tax=Dreissena polymorpha TaxID=45954 RepID=A0A9D3Y2I0_DREPO|nr:hypothetical protein DPMN_194082 [Dreissena polymorpha]